VVEEFAYTAVGGGSTILVQCCTFSRYVAYGRYFINYFAVIGYLTSFLMRQIGYKGLAQLWQKRSQSARADAETMTKEPSNGCMPNSDWHLILSREASRPLLDPAKPASRYSYSPNFLHFVGLDRGRHPGLP
jgi:hypothetical protein